MSIKDFNDINTWDEFNKITAQLKCTKSADELEKSCFAAPGEVTVTLDQLRKKMSALEVTLTGDSVLAMRVVMNITKATPHKAKAAVGEFFNAKLADIENTCEQIQQETYKNIAREKKLNGLLLEGIALKPQLEGIDKEFEDIKKTSERIQKILKKTDKKTKDFGKIEELKEKMIDLKQNGYYATLQRFVKNFEEIALNYAPNNESYREARDLWLMAKRKLEPLEGFKEDELDIKALRLDDQKGKALESCVIALNSKEYKSFRALRKKPASSGNINKCQTAARKAHVQIQGALDAIAKLHESVRDKEPFSKMRTTLEKKRDVLGNWWR